MQRNIRGNPTAMECLSENASKEKKLTSATALAITQRDCGEGNLKFLTTCMCTSTALRLAHDKLARRKLVVATDSAVYTYISNFTPGNYINFSQRIYFITSGVACTCSI